MPEVHARPTRHAAVVGLVVAIAMSLTLPAVSLVPKSPYRFTSRIENLAPYVGQTKCSPTAKPGTVAFANLLLRTYPRGNSLGISRACSAGGTSEHKEGRAFDFGINWYDPVERRQAGELLTWLLKTDRFGNRYAMARRLGIQYMIWNKRIWGAYNASGGWRPYSGASAHREHIHFSLSWNGARRKTSFWNKTNFPIGNPVVDPTPGDSGGGDTSGGSGDHGFPTPTPDDRGRDPRGIPEPDGPETLEQSAPLTDETVLVGSRVRRGTRTVGSLVEGRRYLLEVSGTFRYDEAEGAVADAECSSAPGSSWRRSRSVREDRWDDDHLDLYIDGNDLYASSDSGQDCDEEGSTYRWIYEAERTGRAPLAIWDPTAYDDNRGRLRVRIVDLGQTTTSATWDVPANASAGRSGPVLEGDTDYQVTVTGTWADGEGVTADAECTSTNGVDWSRSAYGRYTDDPYDVTVGRLYRDGLVPRRTTVSARPTSGAAECDPVTHSYSFLWSAQSDMPLNVRVDDPGAYADNTGWLRVSVAEYTGPAVPPDPINGTETLVVDASTSEVTTSSSWPAGTALRLTVRGSYDLRAGDGWVAADAECTSAWNDTRWRAFRSEGWVDGVWRPLGDLMVNGRTPTWVPRDGGYCDGDNVYTLDVTTYRSGPLEFAIADDDFADNAGQLTVTIAPR